MVRWEPNARGRLEQAALELFRERGYDQTTVAEIAERAGLTKRTFFRYYADKREILFSGQAVLNELFETAIAAAPAAAAPIDAVAAGLAAVAGMLQERGELARQRQSVINAHAELQERELLKMAALTTVVAAALRERGVPEPSASLAAEAGIAIFKIAFTRWVTEPHQRPLSVHMTESLAGLRGVVTQ